jgi:hypothetical protein
VRQWPGRLGHRAHRRSIEEERRMQVLVRDSNVDQALKVLKKKMQREGSSALAEKYAEAQADLAKWSILAAARVRGVTGTAATGLRPEASLFAKKVRQVRREPGVGWIEMPRRDSAVTVGSFFVVVARGLVSGEDLEIHGLVNSLGTVS